MATNKYRGIIPAFYACYDDNGEVCTTRVAELTRYLIEQGVQGLYVGGSSGECIYQSMEDRKITLEAVMSEAKGKLTIIAHVACNNTKDSKELAAHAESLGVDAIAAIPPIYFRLPDAAIAKYWNDISESAPNTDFIIYNIPQLAGTALNPSLLTEMCKNPRVVGVKNSSPSALDIAYWRRGGIFVLNGPDDQLAAGLAMGACGGIGGTYGVMPKLFIEIQRSYEAGEVARTLEIQDEVAHIVSMLDSTKVSIYAVIKGILKLQGVDVGSVRAPLLPLTESEQEVVTSCHARIEKAIAKYCK